jgi:hypothetical protein
MYILYLWFGHVLKIQYFQKITLRKKKKSKISIRNNNDYAEINYKDISIK